MAIRTKFVPPYACLFMEREFLKTQDELTVVKKELVNMIGSLQVFKCGKNKILIFPLGK